MCKKKNVDNCVEEIRVSEPDELGWEGVYKNGKLYEKKTIISDNCTTRIYNPIPLRKKENK